MSNALVCPPLVVPTRPNAPSGPDDPQAQVSQSTVPHGAGLADMQLTSMQRKVLTDLTQILGIPYCAQEILSSSHTPTLAMALPTYEDLISSWQEFQHKIPEMAVQDDGLRVQSFNPPL